MTHPAPSSSASTDRPAQALPLAVNLLGNPAFRRMIQGSHTNVSDPYSSTLVRAAAQYNADQMAATQG